MWFTRDQISIMTAAERLSRIGNRVEAYRILAEKIEDGIYFVDYFGDYFGNRGLHERFKMDVEEIHCEAKEWTELCRFVVGPTSCESVYKGSGSQMTVGF